MITEAVVAAIVNGILGLIGSLVNAVLSAAPNRPDYQFAVPQPFWFMVQYVLAQATLIYPLVLSYWVWRQFKA